MAVEIDRNERSIRLTTGELELVVDRRDLRMRLASRRHGTRLTGFLPRAAVAGRTLTATGVVLDGDGEIRTRLGLATRLLLRAGTALPVDMVVSIEVAADWPGLVLALGLENRGDEALPVRTLEPLFWTAGPDSALVLPGKASELRFFRMGYQSWSPAGWVRPGDREPRPRAGLVQRIHFSPCSPLPRPGVHVSDFASALRAPGEAGLALGFLTHESRLTHIAVEGDGAGIRGLAARVAAEDLPLEPGSALEGERLWIGLDAPGEDGIAVWAERAGREMSAPVPARVGSGWCSWYQFRTKVTAADVLRNLEALAPFRGQLETVQIDDGYQAAVGDWLEADASFPDGVEPLGRAIREAGFRPGLWLAPFLASRASRTAREHPDWLLADERGKPRIALVHPTWKGRVCYALDPTHPEVLDWLARVVRTLRGYGFDYLKLDFLYAGALPGRRHDPSLPSGAAYRGAIRAVREAAGEDAFLLGCGAPLGPSIGLFDAMRIGADVAPAWSARVTNLAWGVPAAPSAENSLRNILARGALHQRLWVNDPDCVLLRDRDTKLSEIEVQTLAAAIAVSGGMVLVSDDLAYVGAERRALLRRMLPPIGRTPRVGASAGEVPDELSVAFPDGSVLLLRVNLGARAKRFVVEPRRLGLDGPVRAYDALGDRDLGAIEERFEAGPVPPHGALLLRLVPLARLPGIVGSTLHLAAGAVEAARPQRLAGGGMRLRLRLPGPREGRLLVAGAESPPLALHVAFAHSLEVGLEVGIEVGIDPP